MGHRTSLTDKSCKLWKIFQMTKDVSKNILFVLYLTHLLVGSQISGMGIDRLNCGFFQK